MMTKDRDDDERLLTYQDAAAFLNMTPSALRAAVSRGEIPHIRMAQRRVRFHRKTLVNWLHSCHVPAAPGGAK